MIKVKDIYEKISLKKPLDMRRFFNFLNDTVEELESTHHKFITDDEAECTHVDDVEAEIPVRELYAPAIVDNILYLSDESGANAVNYKQEFIRKAQNAWLRYWHDTAHGKKVNYYGGDCKCGTAE